jgi:DNA-binding transcriptional LysR family regulator
MHGSYGIRQIVEFAEHEEHIRLVPKLTTDSISVIKHFVLSGLGVSLLPAFAVSQELNAAQLVAMPVDNAVLGNAQAHIVTRVGRQLSMAANQLLVHLSATMRAFHSPHARTDFT